MSANIQHQQPLPGQESVWDYPRPPRVEPTNKHIRIVFNGETIAETDRAIRVLETSHPPVYYIPAADIRMEYFSSTSRSTFCEFKGAASYWTIRLNGRASENVAWSYRQPSAGYEAIKNYLGFYPSKVDACYVDDELVQAQEGDFYGGWITKDIVGPFKGGTGTFGW
jgi:uncharacterized protein (DUF427 family)